jgi:hypothetical protein
MNNKHIHISLQNRYLKVVILIVLTVSAGSKLFSQTDINIMKAVAIEKIALFVTWPTCSTKDTTSHEFIIGVVGSDSFSEVLENVYKDEKIKNKRVKVVTITDTQEAIDCDLLYIPRIRISELEIVLNQIKGNAILTISDSDGFAEQGCFINFYENENKLRFEVNQRGMQEEGFNIDYRLLRVSKIINPVPK